MEVRRRITTMFRKRNLPYNVGLLCEESSRCIMPLYRQDNRAIKFAMWISSNDKNIHDRLLKFSRVHCIYIYIYISLVSVIVEIFDHGQRRREKKEEKEEKEEYSTKVFLLYLQERGRRQSCCSFDEIVSVVLVSSRCLKDRKSVSGTIGDIPELIW